MVGAGGVLADRWMLKTSRGRIYASAIGVGFIVPAIFGVGNASKDQVHAMILRLLPGASISGPDAADALAVAITHAHHMGSARRLTL